LDISSLEFDTPITCEDTVVGVPLTKFAGDRFCDVFWEIVLTQFMWLVIDIVGVILLLVSASDPASNLSCLLQGCAPVSRQLQRKLLSEFESAVRAVDSPNLFELQVISVDSRFRSSPNASTLDKTIPELSSSEVTLRAKAQSRSADALHNLLAQFDDTNKRYTAAVETLLTRGRVPEKLAKICDTILLPEEQQIAMAIEQSLQQERHPVAVAEPCEPISSDPPGLQLLSQLKTTFSATLERARTALLAEFHVAEQGLSELPWCGGKEGWSGLRAVVFGEVRQFAYDILALLSFIIVFCSVYRTYYVVRNVFSSHDKRQASVRAILEVLIDILYLFKFIFGLLTVRGVVALPADLIGVLLEQPSFQICREVIDCHLGYFFEEIIYILSLIFAWDAIRFAVATIVFAVFSPGLH